jgi:hypothetical protein
MNRFLTFVFAAILIALSTAEGTSGGGSPQSIQVELPREAQIVGTIG